MGLVVITPYALQLGILVLGCVFWLAVIGFLVFTLTREMS